MRRDLFIALVGAAAIVLAGLGLVTGALREGPIDVGLEPVAVPVTLSGAYHARGDTSLAGQVCLEPPCAARTLVEARFVGLPEAPYRASLEGDGASLSLGLLKAQGDARVVVYDAEADHQDKDALVVRLADRVLVAVAVRPTAQPFDLGAMLSVVYDTGGGTVRTNEIGGVSTSTVAKAHIESAPPAGWQYRAWFEGFAGPVDLGVFAADGDGAGLDARIEHLRLEDQHAFVVYLEPRGLDASEPVGFPLLRAAW